MKKSVLIIVIIILIIILGVLLIINRDKKVSINESFEMKINQTVFVKNENLKIKLLSIIDNTCPKDAQCIRAGEIEYNLQVNSKTIKLDNVNNTKQTYNAYIIKLDNNVSNNKYVKLKVEKIGG